MAKIHKGHNHLKEKARTNLLLSILFILPSVMYFYAFIVHRFHFEGFYHLLGIVPAMIGFSFFRKYSSLKSGIEGESAATNALSSLPSSYEVFSTVQIPTKNKLAEIDNIVVGENGIFVIEVKNHNGTIVGSEEDRSWTQHKVGQKGGEYSSKMNNPVKQVRWQVHQLAEYLRKNGVNLWIEGAVYFSNPRVSLRVSTNRTPVFTSSQALNRYIMNQIPNRKMNRSDIERAIQLILSRLNTR